MSNKREWKVYERTDGKYWWAYIKNPVPSEPGIRRSSGTVDKRQAEEWAKQVAEQLWRQVRLGIEPDKTWPEAVVRWVKERQDKKTIKDDIAKFRWLHPYLGGKRLIDITRKMVMEIATIKAGEASKATPNRHKALISSVLNRAVDVWEWLEKAPSFYKFPEKKPRVRYLTAEDVERLLQVLPSHLRDPVIFSMATGWRESNVVKLEWSQVDMMNRRMWVKGEEFKNGDNFGSPINETAYAVLLRQMGKNGQYVFTYRGHPVTRFNNKAWRKALKRTNIEDFRWHDLRHTYASWLAMAGATLLELQQAGGWRTLSMVKRYANLSPDHFMGVVSRLDPHFCTVSGKRRCLNVELFDFMVGCIGFEPMTDGLRVRCSTN